MALCLKCNPRPSPERLGHGFIRWSANGIAGYQAEDQGIAQAAIGRAPDVAQVAFLLEAQAAGHCRAARIERVAANLHALRVQVFKEKIGDEPHGLGHIAVALC